MKRDYVLITSKHGFHPLNFWGYYTEDNQERQLGRGYTSNFDLCEKVSKEYLKVGGYKRYPVIENVRDMIDKDINNAFISIEDLETHTRKSTMTITHVNIIKQVK